MGRVNRDLARAWQAQQTLNGKWLFTIRERLAAQYIVDLCDLVTPTTDDKECFEILKLVLECQQQIYNSSKEFPLTLRRRML